MLSSVVRSKIFSEFSEEEQEYWFSIKEKAVAHHVDTLYYTVSIKDDDVKFSNGIILEMVNDIANLKEQKSLNLNSSVQYFGLEVQPYGSNAIYVYRLQMPELYDIFFARNIVNDQTPRIFVQIRTHGILSNGLYEILEESFEKVKEILYGYNLSVKRVDYNRFDYAFHSNVIQKAEEYFGTASLNQHLISALSRYGLEGAVPHRVDEDLDIDYFYLGRRQSNYVFFRAYEKTKEVVQMNYKGIFFEKWFERGLISRYDKYVLEYAYKIGSYNTGLIVGRIKWYLEYGNNESFKLELADILDKYNINSSNNRELESRIKGILPPVTKIYNFEFETKRKFYSYFDKFIKHADIQFAEDSSEDLQPIYRVLALRRLFLDLLMTNYVSFVDDRRSLEHQELDWWRRIRSCRIRDVEDVNTLEACREYARKLDLERQRRRFFGNVANFHIFKRKAVEFESGFGEDICDAISFLNDNDIKRSDLAALKSVDPFGYREVKKQRWRQLAPVIKKAASEKNEREWYKNSLYISDDREAFFGKLENDNGFEINDYKNDIQASEWRCVHCDKIYTGEKELTQFVGRNNVYPFQQGICRRCLKVYREFKKQNA